MAKRGRPKKTPEVTPEAVEKMEVSEETEAISSAEEPKEEEPVVSEFRKNFAAKWGHGSVFTMEGNVDVKKDPKDYVSTRNRVLNYHLSGDSKLGFRKGRMVLVAGPNGSSKTTLCLETAAEYTSQKQRVGYFDMEMAISLEYAKSIGVDLRYFDLFQPDNAEDCFEQMFDATNSGEYGLIVSDSLDAMVPKATMDGTMDDATMGLAARTIGRGTRKMIKLISKNEVLWMVVSQIRCLEKSTIIATTTGLKLASDLKEGDFVFGKSGEPTMVTSVTPIGDTEGVILDVKERGLFKISLEHRQPVISNGEYVEKLGSKIKKGDFLIFPVHKLEIENQRPLALSPFIKQTMEEVSFERNNVKIKPIPLTKTHLDEDVAFFMGAFCSDGCFIEHEANSTFAILFSENDKERYELLKDNFKKMFSDFYQGKLAVRVNGIGVVKLFKKLGLKRYGANKTIPWSILQSSKSIMKQFIRGAFFDTHGFDAGNGFIFTSECEKYTFQMREMLSLFGVSADPRKDRSNYYNRLFITGEDAVLFTKEIGFAESKKQKFAEKSFFNSINARGKYDVVPRAIGDKIMDISRKKFKSWSMLPGSAACRANEAAGNNYGRTILLKFLRNNPEEFSEYIRMIENNRFAEIIDVKRDPIDAVEIEVAAKDGLFIASSALTHNCKIGVFFGSPETMNGGEAPKFYSSYIIRVQIDRGEAITETVSEDEPEEEATSSNPLGKKGKTEKKKKAKKSSGEKVEVGNIVKVNILKNKLYPPFKKCNVRLDYGKGYNKDEDLLMYLRLKGVIDDFEYGAKRLMFDGDVMNTSTFLAKYKSDAEFRSKLKSMLAEKEKSK